MKSLQLEKLANQSIFNDTFMIRTINKKRKDSLETWAALLIFLLELEISGVAVQSIHQNSEKWQLSLGTAQ